MAQAGLNDEKTGRRKSRWIFYPKNSDFILHAMKFWLHLKSMKLRPHWKAMKRRPHGAGNNTLASS